MFAPMTFRLPESLRRAGAHLKAFALLEDAPPRPRAPAAPRPGGTAASHAHPRPPRARIDRRTARRPGSVPAGPQPCLTPVRAHPSGTRVAGTPGPLPHGSHAGH
jgi:hypothetical protein